MENWRRLPIVSLLFASLIFVVIIGWATHIPVNQGFQDLITERSYLADPDAQFSIDTVQSQTFTSFQGPLFRGNDSRPLWLKMTVAPSPIPSWVAVFQPNFTHHIEVWLPQASGDWQSTNTGGRLAFNDRVIKSLSPAVPIQVSATEPMTFYARVETPTTPIAVRVISPRDARQFDRHMQFVGGLTMGIGLIMGLLSFVVYVISKDRLWGLDALFNMSGLLILAYQLGFISSMAFPNTPELANTVGLVVMATFLACLTLFHYAIFKLLRMPAWFYWPYYSLLIFYPAELLLIAQGHGDTAMAINNSLILFLVLWGFIISIRGYHPDPLIRYVFRITYSGTLIYMLWWSIPIVLKLQTGNLNTLYPNLPVSLFSMLMMLLLLGRNTQIKLIEAGRLAQQQREAEQALVMARQHHEETQSFLGMLLHEVKNPLSAIRMAVANLQHDLSQQPVAVGQRLQRVQQAVSHLDGVLDRGLEIDQLVQGSLKVHPVRMSVAPWLDTLLTDSSLHPRLRPTVPDDLVVTADEQLVGLMLRNLLDNAGKYAAPTAVIALTVSSTSQHWTITVSHDVGEVGFPDAERIFTKYYRSSTALRQGGMGLGLFWVRGVARLMGGDAHYAKNQQQVEFSVCLPI